MLFRVMRDGDELDEAFTTYWPAYQRWMSRGKRVSATIARDALKRHMPELLPTHDALLARFGESADIARFLTLYKPPPLVRGCTQAIWLGAGGPALVRNYDHAPHLSDGIVLHANWQDTATLCMTDCIWGALDGVNQHGLCVALAFGGRPVSGDGFAAPLLVRYALQTCTSASQAAEAIARVPCCMTYTFVCLDTQGDHATVYAAPDRPSRIDRATTSANHQGRVEWPQYAVSCKTVERLHAVQALLDEKGQTLDGLTGRFLHPPLYRTSYARGSGTLYTSVYKPTEGTLTLHWPRAMPTNTLTCTRGRYQPAAVRAQLGLARR